MNTIHYHDENMKYASLLWPLIKEAPENSKVNRVSNLESLKGIEGTIIINPDANEMANFHLIEKVLESNPSADIYVTLGSGTKGMGDLKSRYGNVNVLNYGKKDEDKENDNILREIIGGTA